MPQTLDMVDKDTFDRVWKIAQEIGIQERHFNELQSGYRNLASTWLLATFAGMGFAISNTFHVDVVPEVFVAALAVAGALGITLLWILDLLVYHRLLDACFIEGLILEEQYPWLPPFRGNMMKTQAGQGVLFRTVGFYMTPIVLLIAIASIALAAWCYRSQFKVASLAAVLVGMGIAILVGRTILAKTENTAHLEKRLEGARSKTGSHKVQS
jgi:hypothetical protein